MRVKLKIFWQKNTVVAQVSGFENSIYVDSENVLNSPNVCVKKCSEFLYYEQSVRCRFSAMSIWSVANQRSVMWGEKGHVIKMGQSEGWSFTCHSSAILYTAHSFLPKVFDTSQTVMFKMKKKIILLLMIVVCLANHVPLIGTQRADMEESFRFWFSYLLVPGWCSVAVGHRRPVYSLVFFSLTTMDS